MRRRRPQGMVASRHIDGPAGLTTFAQTAASRKGIDDILEDDKLDDPCVVERNESGRVSVLATTACPWAWRA